MGVGVVAEDGVVMGVVMEEVGVVMEEVGWRWWRKRGR